VPYACGGSPATPAIPAHQTQVCDDVFAPTQTCDPQPDFTYTWHGCVGSRLDPWHKQHAYPGRKISGIMNKWCGTEILPLTANLIDVKFRINALSTEFETYLPSGIMWGWRALEKEAPLTEANGPFVDSTKKVMILMTDGFNYLSKNDVFHTGNSKADADDLTTELCVNINTANIDIYTIAYEVTDVPTQNMLRTCATNPSMFFDASDANALQDAFEAIGAELIKLRLTH
jgi:hypothetical protein